MRARGKKIVVAQRHKRKRTIFDKLRRLPHMELARMDDIAGCRLIFLTIDDLYSFRDKFHKARFKHVRRNDVDKYNYIKSPKETGYRGIHDIYEYDVNSSHGKDYKGLFVELQYRTSVQHAWATTVDVIGLITESQPKFQEGDDRYERIMALASEILARAFEHTTSSLSGINNEELIQQCLRLDGELGLLKLLRGLNSADAEVSAKKNVILMFKENEKLEVKTYRNATDALRALFELEKENPRNDVVLVRADTSDDVRIAFRNYFSDAGEFIRMVEEGCGMLSGHAVSHFSMQSILVEVPLDDETTE
jgi:ppGpp synthetase/RelA/SpoT-type nucleotidyltranferase